MPVSDSYSCFLFCLSVIATLQYHVSFCSPDFYPITDLSHLGAGVFVSFLPPSFFWPSFVEDLSSLVSFCFP